ncbi:hypothetical protein P5673_028495, partial [Acropora cervicornis]
MEYQHLLLFQNFCSCFEDPPSEPVIPENLNQAYEIMNSSSVSHIVWTECHDGIFIFTLTVIDPEFSFCNLTVEFAVQVICARSLFQELPTFVTLGSCCLTITVVLFSAYYITRYLSIGIASVERPSGANYLLKTTQSLIDNMSEEDQKNAIIVIFLADIEESPKSRNKKEIARMFDEHINKGLLIVIEATSEFYPTLENVKPKYGDTDSRRTWRSKENVDATFVMCFYKDISEYYIHLEDDVISAPSFVPKLQAFINGQPKETWLLLDVAVQGSIAKVYHSRDLSNIASYFYLMYDEMPIDWLMDYWREIKSQDRRVEKLTPPASLFQHIGDISSLKEKGLSGGEQREPFFDQFEQKFKGMNPSATVTTSMYSYSGEPQDAYEKGSGFFWATTPRKGDYLSMKFQTPTVVQRVTVETGCHYAQRDLLAE